MVRKIISFIWEICDILWFGFIFLFLLWDMIGVNLVNINIIMLMMMIPMCLHMTHIFLKNAFKEIKHRKKIKKEINEKLKNLK